MQICWSLPVLHFAPKCLWNRHRQRAPEEAAALQELLHLEVATRTSCLNWGYAYVNESIE